uniref:DUF2179 domain-containing protein n=1 Tax=Agathobacter sp. TaxID=2021311 RepID=UPI003FED8635
MTIFDSYVYYSVSKNTMLYFVVNRFQVGRMTEIIHEIDPGAYISLTEVADIYAANLDKEME